MGAPPSLPTGDYFQVVDPVHDPDQGLRLHQVERYPAGDVLSLRDDALGDVPDDRGLHDGVQRPVLVRLAAGDSEMVQVPVETVLLVQGEESVLQGAFDRGLPGPYQEGCLLPLV